MGAVGDLSGSDQVLRLQRASRAAIGRVDFRFADAQKYMFGVYINARTCTSNLRLNSPTNVYADKREIYYHMNLL